MFFSRDAAVCQAGGVPSTPPPVETPASPTSVRVAVGVMAALAALLLLNAALTWIGRDGVATAIVESGGSATRAEAEQAVVVWLVPYLVVGLLLLASAVFLPRRRRWAHWAGLAGSAALAALTLVSAFTAGAATAASLLLLVLSLAAITSLAARTTKRWVSRRRTDV
jgi:hypothetical protein